MADQQPGQCVGGHCHPARVRRGPAAQDVAGEGRGGSVDDRGRVGGDQVEQAALGHALDRALFSLQVFVEKAGTGGGLFRRLQAEFLTDIGGWLGDRVVLEAAEVYRRLADTWSETASAAVGEAAAADRLAAVRRVAAALPALEREGVVRLAALAARLAP